MQAKASPTLIIPVRLPQSLQYLSLRNSSPKVNQLLRFGCHPRRDLSLPLFCRCLFFCLSSRQGSAVVVAVAVAFPGVKGDLLSPLPQHKSKAVPTQSARQPPDPAQLPPLVTIHHFPLDANPSTFYSLRIFDTLAPLANPIAVTKRTLCAATNPRPHLIQSPESFCSAVNPVPSDGGQHSY